MSLTRLNEYWPRGIARLAAVAAVPTLMWLPCAFAQEVEANAFESSATITPNAAFQYSLLTGSGNTVNVSRVPVFTSSGTKYYDIAIQFTVSSTGQLALASGDPKITASPSPITAGFVSGEYGGPASLFSGNALIKVSGPGVTSGGATEWSLTAASGANPDTFPCSATWYVGSLTNNPLYSRLKTAGITSTAYSYGLIGSHGCQAYSNYWLPGALIGLSQVGNTITINSYSYDGTYDYSTPQDQITYTKK